MATSITSRKAQVQGILYKHITNVDLNLWAFWFPQIRRRYFQSCVWKHFFMIIKNRQMLIICQWVIVLLLLAVCSVRCHWRPPMPGAITSRGLDPVEQSQSSPESTLLTNAGRCPPSNICIPTISCPDVLHLLKKAVKQPNLREQTIALVRIFFSSFHYCTTPALA